MKNYVSELNLHGKITQKHAEEINAIIDDIVKEQIKEDTQHMAWCECGDALEHVSVQNEKGLFVNHEYYCLGCDKTYILVEKKHD